MGERHGAGYWPGAVHRAVRPHAPRSGVKGHSCPRTSGGPLIVEFDVTRDAPPLLESALKVMALKTVVYEVAVRSGVEGTVNEFAHGHGMRRCRYRGQDKAHLQHVLTAIAVNIERLSGLPPTAEAPPPRQPTAFQNYLEQHKVYRP
jgi:hypothetical protein